MKDKAPSGRHKVQSRHEVKFYAASMELLISWAA